MHVKNHMAMWFLWFLWFLRVEYSGNQLYKPLCAFLVFVVLVWFLCGRICGFWSRVVFGSGLRVRSCSCGFLSRVIVSIFEILDKDINVPGYHGDGTCGFCGSVVVQSVPMPMLARPLALCGLIKRFAHCPTSCYVPFCRHWRRPLQNGENDHG